MALKNAVANDTKSATTWLVTVILIESGGVGCIAGMEWGAFHREVGCIFLFEVIFGVQFPGVMASISPRNDRLKSSDLMQFF